VTRSVHRPPLSVGLSDALPPEEPGSAKTARARARRPERGAARVRQGQAGTAQRRRAARGAAARRRRRAGKVRACVRAGARLAPPQQCGRVKCRLLGASERSICALLHAHCPPPPVPRSAHAPSTPRAYKHVPVWCWVLDAGGQGLRAPAGCILRCGNRTSQPARRRATDGARMLHNYVVVVLHKL